MDKGSWWAMVHRVAKSGTQLKRLNTIPRLLGRKSRGCSLSRDISRRLLSVMVATYSPLPCRLQAGNSIPASGITPGDEG